MWHCVRVCVFLCAVFCVFDLAFGAVWKGRASGDFNFLGRFAFEENDDGNVVVGTTEITVTTTPTTQPGLVMALYSDEDFSWPKVWDNDQLTCQQKIACANPNDPNCYAKAIYAVVLKNDTNSYAYTIELKHNARSRFFFAVLANCASSVDNVEYNVHFLNVLENSWSEEFGADQQGLNTLYLVYFLAYIIFLVVQTFSVYKLRKRLHYLHPLVRLFLLVILLEFASITMDLAHFGLYTKDGIGLPSLLQIGDVLDVCSRLLFFLLLLLLARGWTISNQELKYKYAIVVIILLYIAINVGVLIWQYAATDPASTSVNSGLFILLNMLIGIDLVFAVAFIGLAIHSYRSEDNPHKKSLYLKLLIFFGLWFLAPPLTSFAVYQLDDWARDRIVRAITVTVTALAYFVLAGLTWHRNAEEYFDIQTPDIENAIGYEHL